MSRRAGPAARGVSLIEAMIALVVLSFGLMGMIGLKLSMLKMTGHANSRAVASMHAGDILDRIRANPVRAVAGEYDLALATPTPAAPVGVAQVDLAQWRRGLANNLPGGNGSVAVQPDGSALIVVQWTERAEQVDAPRLLSFTFDARL
jgi:type IV pilus assembly protein PilV